MSISFKLVDRIKNEPNLFENLDFDYDGEGRAVTIENQFLLAQMAKKIVMTIIGEDAAFQQYGSTLTQMLYERLGDMMAPLAEKSAGEALVRLQRNQLSQAETQEMTYGEILKRIKRLDLVVSESDPERYVLYADLESADGTMAQIQQVIGG